MTRTVRKFWYLSDRLQALIERAEKLGLAASYYNSGGKHVDNGVRLFPLVGGDLAPDHWRGDHYTQSSSLRELESFLSGYETALADAARITIRCTGKEG